jgi:phenylacetate-CoA ligase
MQFQYYHQNVETLPRRELEKIQTELLAKQVDAALYTPFYQKRLREAGISGADAIKELSDIRRLPFTTKHDLRESFPFGMLAVPRDDVVRLHASSGTTGTPTTVYLTKKDLSVWAGYVARCIYGTGCTHRDVFQNMITYGLFTGGLGFQAGAEEVGMLVIPAGPGNTERQFRMMRDYGTTVVHATPSFLLHIESKIGESGVQRGALALKRAFAGAEPYSEDTRRRIEGLLSIDVYNSYGLSEMNGPGVAFECQCKEGMHIWEDGYIAEIINPETLEPVREGEAGELVLTILCREAMPLLRYRTRDLTSFYTEPCACGRTHRRIRRITGRSDDMLIINGVNVFPSQIEEALMAMSEVGNNFRIIVEKEGMLDRLIVKTEIRDVFFTDDTRPLHLLQGTIAKKLSETIFIHPRVELVESGSLPVSEGKAVRVEDRRAGI